MIKSITTYKSISIGQRPHTKKDPKLRVFTQRVLALAVQGCSTWICFCACIFAEVRCSYWWWLGDQQWGCRTSPICRGHKFSIRTCMGTIFWQYAIWLSGVIAGPSVPRHIWRGSFDLTWRVFPRIVCGLSSAAWTLFLSTRCRT